MSILSEQIHQVTMATKEKMNDAVAAATEEQDVDQILGEAYPHFDAYNTWAHPEVVIGLRRLVRFFGGTSWETPSQAVEATLPRAAETFIPLLLNSLVYGALMGRSHSSVIRKYEVMEKVEELFTSDRFQVEAGLEAMKIVADPDAMAALRRVFINSVYIGGTKVGYGLGEGAALATMQISVDGQATSQTPNLANPSKVFDLYLMVLSTTAPLFYCAGVELGRRWEEEETLEGIMSASEEKP